MIYIALAAVFAATGLWVLIATVSLSPFVAGFLVRGCHIHNYSIFHWDGLLFAYFEYTGNDFEAHAERMAADPTTQRWWSVLKPLQKPLPDRDPGEWWKTIEEAFHQD
jgi:L-rhamnose mutarotase